MCCLLFIYLECWTAASPSLHCLLEVIIEGLAVTKCGYNKKKPFMGVPSFSGSPGETELLDPGGKLGWEECIFLD